MHCDDNTLFVFTHCDNLLFLVVTDEGDSVPFLKRQLQLVYELLQFKLGPKPDVRATGRGARPRWRVQLTLAARVGLAWPRHQFRQHHKRLSVRHSQALRPLLYTMSHLGTTHQSYLVQSIERLEVNEDLRSRWYAAAAGKAEH